MTGYPNKIVTIVLAFVMLVIAPLVWSYVRTDMTSSRLVLNEVEMFIDKVTDKSSITKEDIDDLYLGVSSSGGTFDVKVKRYVRMATQNADGTARTIYLAVATNEDAEKATVNMNIGDVVKVTVEEVGISPARRLLYTVLRVDEGKRNFSLAGSVR